MPAVSSLRKRFCPNDPVWFIRSPQEMWGKSTAPVLLSLTTELTSPSGRCGEVDGGCNLEESEVRFPEPHHPMQSPLAHREG